MTENPISGFKNGPMSCIAVTGLSGAGRNTALNVLEDCGYHRIDNIPPDLLERLFAQPMDARPLALGFGGMNAQEHQKLEKAFQKISKDIPFEVLFMDASDDVLLRRFSETRRRHPFSGDSRLLEAIHDERALLKNLKKSSTAYLDSSNLSPHDLKREIKRLFALEEEAEFRIHVQSFSYKHGLPRDADLVFDCRFLRNPHWDEALRPLDGRNASVSAYVHQDPLYMPYKVDIKKMLSYILPAAKTEGRSYFTICFGCSGGRHRSVAMAEEIYGELISEGWQSMCNHRELDIDKIRKWAFNMTISHNDFGIVIVAHGGLAEQYLATLQHVIGKQERVQAIAIEDNDDRSDKRLEIAQIVADNDKGSGVVIVTDMSAAPLQTSRFGVCLMRITAFYMG